MGYTQHFSTKQTPQSDPIPGENMVENSAGGFVYQLDKWAYLNRFLILGSEGGSYYVGEHKMTQDNAKNVIACIQEDGKRAIDAIVSVSESGRAPKNDPAIFALALACTFGNPEIKKYAYSKITAVCRIGTFLFTFCQCIQDLRGWSRGLRNGVSKFYTERSLDDLALQLVKYQQRNGWAHRDVLRLAHSSKIEANNVLRYGAWGTEKYLGSSTDELFSLPKLIQGFEKIKGLDRSAYGQAVRLITDYKLPRECVPTEFFDSKEVWAALLEHMPMMAMVRNLGKMTSVGLLESAFDEAVKKVCATLLSVEQLKKSKIHPLSILTALATYKEGRGMKGSLTWTPVMKICEALNEAFYLAFDNVIPTGKNILLGLDVSGSMDDGNVAGSPLTPREASAAMAMVTYRTEPNVEVRGFSDTFVKIDMRKDEPLDELVRRISNYPFSRTDCSIPMRHALEKKLPVDTFVVYTDSETWFGGIHPVQALRRFRNVMQRDAKLIVVGMTATEFTIADPNDPGMLDVVGMDSSAPAVISEFAKGM